MHYIDDDLLEDLKNNFKGCDHPEANGFTFSLVEKGKSGGNCWGNSATSFRKDTSEMIESIQEEIISGAQNYFHMLSVDLSTDSLREQAYNLAEKIVDNPYDTHYESEYYGNHYESNKYFVSIDDILDFLEDTISVEEKESILFIAEIAQNEVVSENIKENKFKFLKETERSIANFTKDCAHEEQKLKADLERALKEMDAMKKKLSTFEKTQLKKLENLEKTKNELISFLGADYILSKETNKRKYGH